MITNANTIRLVTALTFITLPTKYSTNCKGYIKASYVEPFPNSWSKIEI